MLPFLNKLTVNAFQQSTFAVQAIYKILTSNPDIKNGSARVEPPTEKPSADHNLGGYFAAVSVRVPAAVLREIKD